MSLVLLLGLSALCAAHNASQPIDLRARFHNSALQARAPVQGYLLAVQNGATLGCIREELGGNSAAYGIVREQSRFGLVSSAQFDKDFSFAPPGPLIVSVDSSALTSGALGNLQRVASGFPAFGAGSGASSEDPRTDLRTDSYKCVASGTRRALTLAATRSSGRRTSCNRSQPRAPMGRPASARGILLTVMFRELMCGC